MFGKGTKRRFEQNEQDIRSHHGQLTDIRLRFTELESSYKDLAKSSAWYNTRLYELESMIYELRIKVHPITINVPEVDINTGETVSLEYIGPTFRPPSQEATLSALGKTIESSGECIDLLHKRVQDLHAEHEAKITSLHSEQREWASTLSHIEGLLRDISERLPKKLKAVANPDGTWSLVEAEEEECPF